MPEFRPFSKISQKMKKILTKSLVLLLCLSAPLNLSAAELTVTFLDVGQGDSILIQTPNGKSMLIDAGGMPSWKLSDYDPGESVVAPFLKSNNINKLDCVVATHADGDHIGGLPAVIRSIPAVGIVYENGFEGESPEYQRLHEVIKSRKIFSSTLRAGMHINLDPSVTFYVLSPPKDFYFEDSNNNSIVMRMVYGEVSFLFAADVEYEGEYNILRKYSDKIQSTILKVGHHGSSTSTSDEFFATVSPEIVVIPVGKYNGFGHPYTGTMAKFSDAGTEVFRTDQVGYIRIDTDGNTFGVKTERAQIKIPNNKKKR